MIVSWSARYTITRSSGSNPVQWKEIGCLGRRSLGGSDGLFGPQLVDGCVGWVGWLVDQLVGWSAGWFLFISEGCSRVWRAGGIQNLTDRVGPGQEVSKFHEMGRGSPWPDPIFGIRPGPRKALGCLEWRDERSMQAVRSLPPAFILLFDQIGSRGIFNWSAIISSVNPIGSRGIYMVHQRLIG